MRVIACRIAVAVFCVAFWTGVAAAIHYIGLVPVLVGFLALASLCCGIIALANPGRVLDELEMPHLTEADLRSRREAEAALLTLDAAGRRFVSRDEVAHDEASR